MQPKQVQKGVLFSSPLGKWVKSITFAMFISGIGLGYLAYRCVVKETELQKQRPGLTVKQYFEKQMADGRQEFQKEYVEESYKDE